jgi:hypothetical protein
MTVDPTNVPFQRALAGQSDDTSGNVSDTLDSTLKMENMLLEEFNYASVTAYQAMEDRARTANFYYVLLGVLASGLVAIYQLSGGHPLPLALIAILLFIGSTISVTFFVLLIRLRQAYRESITCMNVIKEFYIEHFKQQMPKVEYAFHWRLKTIPQNERIGSVTFMMGYQIAFIGSICLGGTVFVITQPLLANVGASILAVLIFLLALLLYILYYRRSLNNKNDRVILQQEAAKIGVTL